MFYNVFDLEKIVHISAARRPIEMRFEFKWASNLYCKIKIEYCCHVTHSPSSCHICFYTHPDSSDQLHLGLV